MMVENLAQILYNQETQISENAADSLANYYNL